MERKRIVIYSHAYYDSNSSVKETETLGKTMQKWAEEHGMIPVAMLIEVSNETNISLRPGIKQCILMAENGTTDAVLVLCREAISNDINVVINFLSEIENTGAEVISLRNDLPNEDGQFRFEIIKPKCEVISFAKVINIL